MPTGRSIILRSKFDRLATHRWSGPRALAFRPTGGRRALCFGELPPARAVVEYGPHDSFWLAFATNLGTAVPRKAHVSASFTKNRRLQERIQNCAVVCCINGGNIHEFLDTRSICPSLAAE
jgi:hypothetical protein